MKVRLESSEIESKSLSWLCIKPMLLAVRGKDFSVKTDMYNQLNEGQKALYLFYSFHNHTKTLEEFYWFSAYYINELNAWNGIKSGLGYFQDRALPELMDDIEVLFVERSGRNNKISPTDLDNDNELKVKMIALYEKYQNNSEAAIRRMNAWIIANRQDFIEEEV